jgi:hypothetical protein
VAHLALAHLFHQIAAPFYRRLSKACTCAKGDHYALSK